MKLMMNMDTVAVSPLSSGHILQAPEPSALHPYRQNVALGEVMKASKLFHGLQLWEIAEISTRLQPMSCKRGERILEQGIRHGRLYIVASGQVSVLLQDDAPREGEEGTTCTTTRGQARQGQDSGKRERSRAQPYIIAQFGPGECFGEMELMTGEP